MPKLPRVTAVLFGSTGPGTDFGQFGSKKAAAPQTEADFGNLAAFIAGCQGLTAWLQGWADAAVGAAFNPFLEDENGAYKVFSYYINQLCERGISDWDAGTTYFKGAYVNDPAGSGQTWYSLTDNNLNNAPPLLASNAQWQWSNPPLPNVFGLGNGVKAGLLIKPNVGAPTTKIDVSADILSVQGITLSAVAATINTAVLGFNGLDSGVIAANQKYAIFVICKNDGSLPGGLISLSGTAPALPAGYTKFRRVGWIFTTAGALIYQFMMTNDWWYFIDATQFVYVPIAGTNSFGAAVPSTSRLVAFKTSVRSGVGVDGYIDMKVTGAPQPLTRILETFNSGATINIIHAAINFPTDTNQQIDIALSGTQPQLIVLGYYDPV